MPQISSSVAPNGLPVHRVALEGTRATTLLVAFDASGARTKQPEENGMAHFLEHLVFKGGQVYDDYRKVNETAERMGGSLNAYTSHDLVAFHITVRAESAMEALDLLSDFIRAPGWSTLRQGARRRHPGDPALQGPARGRRQGVDRAAFGDHPLGRTVLRTRTTCARSRGRKGSSPYRERRSSGERGGAFLVGDLDHVDHDGKVDELLSRFPRPPHPSPSAPAPPFAPQKLVEEREPNQSHLRMIYRRPQRHQPQESNTFSFFFFLLVRHL